MKSIVLFIFSAFYFQIAQAASLNGMQTLTDEELSETNAQALFSLSYMAPGDTNNPYNGSSDATRIGFYTLSMEAEVKLNANIKSLQVGCGGVNGYGACDLDIQNFSLGCVANADGVCITLPKTYANQPNGSSKNNSNILTTSQEASGNIPLTPRNSTLTASASSGNITQSQLKDFVINNPFYQFAIRNPESAATREIVGIRIGGANVKGPMSFGSLNMFSGYLTGTSNLDMQEMGKGRNPNDVAVTCGTDSAPCPGSLSGTGYNTFGYIGDRTMGLDNDQGCVLFICEEFKNLTVKFDGAQRISPVTVNGSRVTQAQVSDLRLGAAVDGIVNSLEFVQSNGMSAGLLNFIKGLIQDQVKTKIKTQLATGLGTTVAALDNNTYVMPFNLNNVHQLEIDSSAFGIALSKEALRYPGYVSAVPQGWSMYIPNGFTLNISEPTTRLVQNIVGGAGADGNIALLAAPYRNCYGNLTFC